MNEVKEQGTRLQFSGNWLIDAGILGFVNLMEDVYGWDLKSNEWKLPVEDVELQGRFFFAFWYKIISETVEQWLNKDNLKKKAFNMSVKEKIISNVLDILKQNKDQIILKTDFQDIPSVKESILCFNKKCKESICNEFQYYKDALNKKYSQNKKTILENLNSISFIAYSEFFTNLSIFNPSTNKSGNESTILELFSKLVCHYSVRNGSDILDKSMNVFLFSADDFHNIYFGSPPTLKKIEDVYRINPTYVLLSVPWSFIKIQENHFFHTNSLENSYHIHRNLQRYKENLQTNRKLLDITWKVVIDFLVERKSDFSLENLHIIEYSSIDPTKQQIQNVEYLSISKLNATLLLDETMRENLNKTIPCNENRKRIKYVWLTEQLCNERPLTPLIVKHVELFIKKRNNNKGKNVTSTPIYLSLGTSLYALMIDANKQKLSINELHFNHDFFMGYSELVDDIKKDVNYIRYASDAFSKCITDENEQDLYILLATIKGNDRNQYLNLLYRILVTSKEELDRKWVSDYAFKNIIKNKNTWTYYGLALILKAIKTCKKK